jgi:hypothetical protein
MIGYAVGTYVRWNAVGMSSARQTFRKKTRLNFGLGKIRTLGILLMKEGCCDPYPIRNTNSV